VEVSAHALALDKTEGIVFEVGVLTNLTQDHLDFFKTMENYQRAKLKLFEGNKIKSAVLNFDDEFGRKLAEIITVPFLSYSLNNPSDVFAAKIGNKNGKNKFIVNILDNVFDVESNLIGEFNIYNSLAAASVAAMLGCSTKQIKNGLEKLFGVEGRLNRFNLSNGVVAFIDFAHTPDGIEKALNAIRELKFKQIITVFGCSGNRDKDKRHKMGQIAEKLSDYVVLTTDNPRFENPELILDDIEIGMEKTAHTRFVSREQAIEFALTLAKKGDCVAILGKGAETYQDINGVNVPYSDFEVVKNFNENLHREFFEKNLKA
ncbi:MAG: UDP-N-acetylmuramoyl-L-alanyl-D-glutamate--2,6-diaminopimelate ligase, partial [Eubacteriales bacterium]|nr:UDP-N-acetylmuramoyl-L-alanyl-D-glutamate--2,6-diaminopimelate ligase [Eubacteriales bacterium]